MLPYEDVVELAEAILQRVSSSILFTHGARVKEGGGTDSVAREPEHIAASDISNDLSVGVVTIRS